MKDVKNPLVISEYYPRILPPAGTIEPAPVTRLTPHFHDITSKISRPREPEWQAPS